MSTTLAQALSGMSERTSKTKSSKPTLSVDKSVVDEFVSAKTALKAAETPFEAAKTHLLLEATQPFFDLNRNLAENGNEVVSSAELVGNKGKARITITSRYSLAKPDDVREKGFNDLVEQGYLVERCDIRVDSDKIPEASRIPFVLKLKELAKECGVGEDAISYSHGYAPRPVFHQDRYRLLSVERNLALQKVAPATLYVA